PIIGVRNPMNTISTPEGPERISPGLRARIAGGTYLIVFVTGTLGLITGNSLANLIAGVGYIAVTVLFYSIFKPVSRSLSMLAAGISFAGIIVGIVSTMGLLPFRINPLVFFGFYCLLIGYLIFKSTFLPRFLG